MQIKHRQEKHIGYLKNLEFKLEIITVMTEIVVIKYRLKPTKDKRLKSNFIRKLNSYLNRLER